MKKVKLNMPVVEHLSLEELDKFVNSKLSFKEKINNCVFNILNKGIDLLNKSNLIKFLVFVYQLKKKGQKLENVAFTYVTYHDRLLFVGGKINSKIPMYVTNVSFGKGSIKEGDIINVNVKDLNIKYIS